MKAVNLLPAAERPRAVAKPPANASVIVLAVLGALLVGVAGWVFTKNQVNDRQTSIATANQEKAEADQRSQGLKAFGDFRQVKQTRVQSITDLATKRFDWERFMRELALVLPDKVWVADVTSGEGATTGAPAASPAPDPQSSGASSGARTVTIKGCAPSQKSVAATMVRLRTLYGAQEVDLKDSARSEQSGSAAPAVADSGGGGEQSCGRYYQFNASVTFKEATPGGKGEPVRAPSRLGGGA